jgi:hypothetical protein
MKEKPPRRPFTLYILVLVLLGFTILSLVRATQAFLQWDFLVTIDTHPGPLYPLLTGSFWAVWGVAAIIGLWLRRKFALSFAAWLVAGYTIWFWVDRLLVAVSPPANTGFAIGSTLFWIVITGSMLLALHKGNYGFR